MRMNEPAVGNRQSAGRNQAVLRLPIAHFRVPPTWWSLTGSNRRHPACKAGALPAELRPRIPWLDHIMCPTALPVRTTQPTGTLEAKLRKADWPSRTFARPVRRIAALAALIREDKTWWAWIDSNYRPHPYQGCALTT